MKKLGHKDYQVCWICPLDIERTAAEAMLDEKHESLPSSSQEDSNIYTLGRIGIHNIAIAGLPVGDSVSMANAAKDMKYTFPAMRVVLLVGIGGGSGTKHIRLGDIVIGYPDRKHNGVVQLDPDRVNPTSTNPDGLELKNTLNRPRDLFLNVVKALQSKHQGLSNDEEPGFVTFLNKAIEARPRMRARYPGADEDRLFEPTYEHPGAEVTCESCNHESIVPRSSRPNTEPEIHTGLIASVTSVRRDSLTRDKLRQKFNILCFEMEAAGVMNNFPCLVIRGISDYSDSHKNDIWQPYAALAAAAYAKEWLLTFPVVRLNELELVAGVNHGE
jgi:nucleoside phosphorylase